MGRSGDALGNTWPAFFSFSIIAALKKPASMTALPQGGLRLSITL
jgi:hypothetical protein